VDKSYLQDIFSRFSEIRAIVIGDAMVDSYLWGKVERVSPEAPIPIVSVIKKESRLGGAANVALNLQALGAIPYLFTVTGDDEKGRKLLKLMEKNHLSTGGLLVDPGRCTTVKSRIISGGRHIARVDEESTDPVDGSLELQIIDGIRKTIESTKIDVIIFVDYDKGVITPGLFRSIKELAKRNRLLIAVDPKKRNFGLYEDVDLFKPNFKEFTEGTGINLAKGDLEGIRKAAEAYKKEKNFGFIFITLSEMGVFLSNSISENYFPAQVRQISDVSGAGDTVVSVASLCLAAGTDPRMLACFSNIAGGLVCEKVGVVPIDREALLNELEKLPVTT
jgi:D-glycero-beta-D-manno-heptose-7-phosphate kinase